MYFSYNKTNKVEMINFDKNGKTPIDLKWLKLQDFFFIMVNYQR